MGSTLNTSKYALCKSRMYRVIKSSNLSLLDLDSQPTRKLDVKVVDILKFKQGFGCYILGVGFCNALYLTLWQCPCSWIPEATRIVWGVETHMKISQQAPTISMSRPTCPVDPTYQLCTGGQ
jgi:hypothetical protein